MKKFPKGKYRVILADPPWRHETWSEAGLDGRPQHYARLSIDEIKALPVADLAADDCWLFLWTTVPHLELAFEVLRAWGFEYSSTGFIWIKVNRSAWSRFLRIGLLKITDFFVGQGYTTRKNAEICLLGRRGKPGRISENVHELIVAPIREHSRKPEEAHERIEAYCEGPRIELFARAKRKGWTVWGNETDKFS